VRRGDLNLNSLIGWLNVRFHIQNNGWLDPSFHPPSPLPCSLFLHSSP
jgi:hypothetical protein